MPKDPSNAVMSAVTAEVIKRVERFPRVRVLGRCATTQDGSRYLWFQMVTSHVSARHHQYLSDAVFLRRPELRVGHPSVPHERFR